MTATTAQYYQCGPTLLQSNLCYAAQQGLTTLWTILAQFKDFQNKCLSLPNKHNIKLFALMSTSLQLWSGETDITHTQTI